MSGSSRIGAVSNIDAFFDYAPSADASVLPNLDGSYDEFVSFNPCVGYSESGAKRRAGTK